MADERLLPAGIRDERSRTLLALMDRLEGLDLSKVLIYDIDGVDASALPHLGWQFHVMGPEGWELALTDRQRRDLVKQALELHRYKGTRWAVRQALDALGVRADIVEWFEPAGDGLSPYEFGLRATVRAPVRRDQLLGAEATDAIIRAVDAYKNVRSHLGWIAFAVEFDMPIGPDGITDERLVIDTTRARIPWFPVFDITALDAEQLDPDPFEQRREVVDVSPVAVIWGRPSRLDRRLSEGYADQGPQMDLALVYREGELVPPMELVQRTVVSVATLTPAAPAPSSSALALPASEIALSPSLASLGMNMDDTPTPARAEPARGYDLMPSLDGTPADVYPLDIAMEAVHA
ncbi:phage tail protein I [Roseospira visakhapatnamensis]|uniref:Phage tail P2-like protein n=1 Tax=Roseospira visakhapatnamensis TaxID=390880 RepID=A0A7W6WC48_9PROT|nr:phage tail protein I [Roseospira visakhapatnamensis]MBB4268232.1 phage tail P2-like protein [Roseospira visakhapatnamensis]